MYGRTSDKMQSRTRRAADASDRSGGINASDAFKPNVVRSLDAEEVFRLTLKLQEAQARLTRMNAKFGPKHPDRFRAVADVQETSLALNRIKGRVKADAIMAQSERDKRWERAFIAVAKQMLAEPVYRRLVTAAEHRMDEQS
jgi:hypothetical protein